MPTQTSPNSATIVGSSELLPPRNAGRGRALDSTGATQQVVWNGTSILVGGVPLFDLAYAPYLLDVAFDQLDRPQVSWQDSSGFTHLRFYDGTIPGYRILELGNNAAYPAICNDYALEGGVNTVIVYVKSGYPTYRIQQDRFTIEYRLYEQVIPGIKRFGYGVTTNSIQIVIGEPDAT